MAGVRERLASSGGRYLVDAAVSRTRLTTQAARHREQWRAEVDTLRRSHELPRGLWCEAAAIVTALSSPHRQ